MSYDNWKTTTPADRAHIEECICDACHESHIENGLVSKQFESPDYECCEIEMFKWISQGIWCAECNSDAYMKEGKCLNHEVEVQS